MLASLVAGIVLLGPPATPIQVWQKKYDHIVDVMKKFDFPGYIKLFHPKYNETVNGKTLNLEQAKQGFTQRMNTMAKYGKRPKVVDARVIEQTATVTIVMTFEMKQKRDVLTGISTVRDTWLKDGDTFKLFRSATISSVVKKNGRVIKPGKRGQ